MKEVIMQVASYSSDYPKAPIYVADLVRCKECKWWHKLHGCIKNDDVNLCTNADDFCSYGERKESRLSPTQTNASKTLKALSLEQTEREGERWT